MRVGSGQATKWKGSTLMFSKREREEHREFCEQAHSLVDLEEVRGTSRHKCGRALIAIGVTILHKEGNGDADGTMMEVEELLDQWLKFKNNG